MRLFERQNTTTTLTNLLADVNKSKREKKRNERLLTLRKYNVVCIYKKRQDQYIHTAPSANQNITNVFCRRYKSKIDLD